jgi:hypothetical protein
MMETALGLVDLTREVVVQLHLLAPEPGTQLVEQLGTEIGYDGHISDQNFAPLSNEDCVLIEDSPDLFMTYFHFPTLLSRERNVAISSVYNALCLAGTELLIHALELTGRGLAAFLLGIVGEDEESGGRSVESKILDFLCETLGPHHYVASLYRYVFAARRLLSGGTCRPSEKLIRAGGGADVVVAPNCLVLEDMHDCPGILAYLRTHGMRGVVGDGDLANRRMSLGLRVKSRDESLVAAVELPVAASRFLAAFEEVSTPDAVVTRLGFRGTGRRAAFQFIDELVKAGFLMRLNGVKPQVADG